MASLYANFELIWRNLDPKAQSTLTLFFHRAPTIERNAFYIITCLTSGKQSSGEEHTDVMPTGRVVGVLQRNWRDYVASFAENEVSFYLIHITF